MAVEFLSNQSIKTKHNQFTKSVSWIGYYSRFSPVMWSKLKIVTIQWKKSRIWNTIDGWYINNLAKNQVCAVFHSRVITGASRRLEPVITFVFSMSRFQGPSFRCNRIVVIVTLLEAIEGIPDSTKIIIYEGTKTSTIFTRDYFMSENLRVDI